MYSRRMELGRLRAASRNCHGERKRSMDLRLKDHRALVTGATAGIGRAIAVSLAGEGVRLALVGRRPALLKEVAAECATAGSDNALLVEVDMMDDEATELTSAQEQRGLGGVDILINCMGAGRQLTPDESEELWDESMTLNWTRHRQLTQEVMPTM